jgi:hypothetical protein
MTRVIEFLISLAIVAVLFLVVGVFLPSHRHVSHQQETNHPVRQVFDTINSFKRFGDWHPLRMHDPAIQYTVSGPEAGVGAKLAYASQNKRIGEGSYEITRSELDSQVEFAIQSPSYGYDKTSIITLDERGKTVGIDWEYDVDYGFDIFGRYAGLYVTRTVGDDMKLGLGNLVGPAGHDAEFRLLHDRSGHRAGAAAEPAVRVDHGRPQHHGGRERDDPGAQGPARRDRVQRT